MEVRLSCAICMLLLSLLADANEEIKNCKPAYITKQGRRKLPFQEESEVSIPCTASGDPPLKYTWLKDDEEFNPQSPENADRMSIVSGVGSLTVHKSKASDAGTYQCKVQNPCGTSLSQKTLLQHAHILPFPQKDEPTKLSAVLGKSLKLSCTPPTSVPEAQISWILNAGDDDGMDMDYNPAGQEEGSVFTSVPTNRRITMDYAGNLYFVYVEKADAQNGKIYSCMASNAEVRSMNQGDDKIIDIFGSTMTDSPTELMWHSETEVLALEGQKAKFKCIFSGHPMPQVSWKRVDSRIDESRMKKTADEHEFIISDVRFEDAGQYECSGVNEMINNERKQRFTLTVESYPRWSSKWPSDISVGVEENAVFRCDVDAVPEATIQWYINGVPIEEAPPAGNRKHHGNILEFTSVNQNDSQAIQCNASNIHGYQWADVYLEVQAQKPTIVWRPTEQKVVEDSNVVIPCGVEGKPRPKVVWYKGDQKLDDPRYNYLSNGDLEIRGVDSLSDSDSYKCVAKNRYGQAEAEGRLVVRRKTQIVSPPINSTVNYGEPVVFSCGAITDPLEEMRKQYTWYRNGVKLTHSDPRFKRKGSELIINATSSKDSGKYMCNVTNDLDFDTAEAELKVIAPPDPPLNMSVVSCESTRADLTWYFDEKTMSNYSPLKEFAIEYNTNHYPGVWKEAKRVPANSRGAGFDMSSWTTYTFRVRARNTMGISEPSQPSKTQCKSSESRPLRNPSNVETIEDKTGYLTIKWEPMPLLEHNSRDFHYVVNWRKEGEKEVKSEPVRDWEQDHYRVKVDGVYEPYVVSVMARNSLGNAVELPVNVSGFSGEAVPNVRPQGFELDPNVPLTATSAGFRWDPVDTSPEAMNGKFLGYKIRYWKKNQFNTTLHQELVIPESRHRRATQDNMDDASHKIAGKVSGLPSFSNLSADVVAVNTYFSSLSSNVVDLTTDEGVPARVEYLEAMFRGSSHFLLEWGPPVEPNGILTGYQLGYQKIVGLRFDKEVIYRDNIPPGKQRANIDNLAPSSLYRIFVRARTKQGVGSPYFIDVRTTDENSELAEPKIESVLAGEHEANITFSLTPEKGKRTGSIYYVEYRKFGENAWDRDQDGATDHFYLTLDKLEPATTYEVRVVSVHTSPDKNQKESKPSMETRFDTAGIGAKKGNVLSAGWFIGMMVAIAILLLLLIIICIVKRNRGKEYKFPPEKDTVDDTPGHFNEMAKSEKNGVNPSSSFDRDPEKVPLEDETDSLEDYGDVDPTKFNEDGSFIGQYGDGKMGTETTPNTSSIV